MPLLHCLVASLVAVKALGYCTPLDVCWPSSVEWAAFGSTLEGGLHEIKVENLNLAACNIQDLQEFSGKPFEEWKQKGMCLYNMNCYSKNCVDIPWKWSSLNVSWDGLTPNLPSYAVSAVSVADIAATLLFANQHDIAVTVRVNGHSYTGSSTGHGTLLVWMANFDTQSQRAVVMDDFEDSCGESHGPVMRASGSLTWRHAYEALAADGRYDMVSGYCPSVSVSGGWLQGGGGLSSSLGRKHGLGIDQVKRFEAVLANGSFVTVDACSHPELFWALRGGGGGTYAVVTATHHKMHPKVPFYNGYCGFAPNASDALQEAWAGFWARESPYMDRRWGGSFNGLQFAGGFFGPEEEGMKFINKCFEFNASLPDELEPWNYFYAGLDFVADHYSANYNATTPWLPPTLWAPGKNHHSNWLIPNDWVKENPELAAQIITRDIHTDTYFLGGAVLDVPENATAVNPATRKALWNLITKNATYAKWLRELLPESGSDYNHASAHEPNYKRAFWGSNYEKLAQIKKLYDPSGRFKCENCVELELAPAESFETLV